ncbi:unnamed protein product [Arctogadus glacialis]
MEAAVAGGADLTRKFVSEAELDEARKKRQEEWEQVRKPDDPEEAPEEDYDHRCLFERLQEQKDKKQEDFEEQFKFKNMVKGLDEDESHFLDECSRQQSLVEKQRRDEEKKEMLDALVKRVTVEPEKKAGPKPLGAEQKTSHLSQAHLLAGAVKRRSSSQSSDSGKKPKIAVETGASGQDTVGGGAVRAPGPQRLLLPSAAVCVGVLPGLAVLPGLGVYSGSSDSESSSDSEV